MNTFTVIIIVLSTLWLGSEIALSRLKRARATDSRLDRYSLHILWIAILIGVNAGVFLGMQRFGNFGNGSAVFPSIGIAFIVSGLVVRWLAILSLKRQFTVDVAITKDHHIVRRGVYRFIRHPAYTGSLLSFLGLGLFFSNYLSVLVIFVPICSAFVYRIHVEEKALLAMFGDEYLNYCRSTKRFLPGIF